MNVAIVFDQNFVDQNPLDDYLVSGLSYLLTKNNLEVTLISDSNDELNLIDEPGFIQIPKQVEAPSRNEFLLKRSEAVLEILRKGKYSAVFFVGSSDIAWASCQSQRFGLSLANTTLIYGLTGVSPQIQSWPKLSYFENEAIARRLLSVYQQCQFICVTDESLKSDCERLWGVRENLKVMPLPFRTSTKKKTHNTLDSKNVQITIPLHSLREEDLEFLSILAREMANKEYELYSVKGQNPISFQVLTTTESNSRVYKHLEQRIASLPGNIKFTICTICDFEYESVLEKMNSPYIFFLNTERENFVLILRSLLAGLMAFSTETSGVDELYSSDNSSEFIEKRSPWAMANLMTKSIARQLHTPEISKNILQAQTKWRGFVQALKNSSPKQKLSSRQTTKSSAKVCLLVSCDFDDLDQIKKLNSSLRGTSLFDSRHLHIRPKWNKDYSRSKKIKEVLSGTGFELALTKDSIPKTDYVFLVGPDFLIDPKIDTVLRHCLESQPTETCFALGVADSSLLLPGLLIPVGLFQQIFGNDLTESTMGKLILQHSTEHIPMPANKDRRKPQEYSPAYSVVPSGALSGLAEVEKFNPKVEGLMQLFFQKDHERSLK